MEEPTDGVVDRLRLREGLVTALVSNDPEARGDEASSKGIQGPQREAQGGVEVGMGERQVRGCDQRVRILGAFIEARKQDKVPHAEVC